MKPAPALPLDEIDRLYAARGDLQYGESVTQREHALQCATLAEQSGAGAELVVAALLHDIGHLLHRDAAGALQTGANDVHEALGAKALGRWFGPGVAQPVALHVQAKRFLCAREPGYLEGLSAVSRRSLEIQGGPMSAAQTAVFERLEHASGALLVRRWDDLGKQAQMATPPLAHFLAIAGRCLLPRRAGAVRRAHRGSATESPVAGS
jgi:phosphonate degradation associated HDIG domain protein